MRNKLAHEVKPSHIVVDGRDGYVFSRDGSGALMDLDRAMNFAMMRNTELSADWYQVYRLIKPTKASVTLVDQQLNQARRAGYGEFWDGGQS